MDHSDQQHAQKFEPTLNPGDAAVAAGDMPAWLSHPPAPETALQRWVRRIKFLGIAAVAVALTGGATLLGLNLYESYGSMAVVADSSQAELAARMAKSAPQGRVEALPFAEKRSANLPPLVLLPQDAAKKAEAAAALAAAPAAAVAAETPPRAPPVVSEPAPPAKVVTAPAPLLAKKIEKAPVAAAKPVKVATAVAPPAKPGKVAAAVSPAAKPAVKPKPAAKKPIPAKTVVAKAKPVKGTMLQPSREREDDQVSKDPPRQAIDRRCRPGELARECAARIQ